MVHVIRLASFLWLWFQCVCPLIPSCNTYHLTRLSLTLDWLLSSLLMRVFTLGKIVFLRRDALGRLMYVWFSPVDWSWLLLLQGQNNLPPSLENEMIDKDETIWAYLFLILVLRVGIPWLLVNNTDIAKSQACIISHNAGHGLNVYIPFHMVVLFCIVCIILWDWNGQGLALLSTKNITDIF